MRLAEAVSPRALCAAFLAFAPFLKAFLSAASKLLKHSAVKNSPVIGGECCFQPR